ncbi:hypothetical protein Dimus_009984 [Dionaea muscipula]
MTSIFIGPSYIWSSGAQQCNFKGKIDEVVGSVYFCPSASPGSRFCQGRHLVYGNHHDRAGKRGRMFCSSMDSINPEDPENNTEEESCKPESKELIRESFRENLERIVSADDSTFSGTDLAALIRNKYGRSYDVLLIKKEFMGRNLLAMNVMWKYREQRSFPLTEEEYILRLDDIANTLKCWGAVSHIRNSLARLKERPRIGKAVSIFIDMDESGVQADFICQFSDKYANLAFPTLAGFTFPCRACISCSQGCEQLNFPVFSSCFPPAGDFTYPPFGQEESLVKTTPAIGLQKVKNHSGPVDMLVPEEGGWLKIFTCTYLSQNPTIIKLGCP